MSSSKKIDDQQEKNICPMGKKYMARRKKKYGQQEKNIWPVVKRYTVWFISIVPSLCENILFVLSDCI